MIKYSPVLDANGKLIRLSVSQLSRFDHSQYGGCQRKWWLKYKGKVPEPESPHQNAGKEGHKRLEDYFKGRSLYTSLELMDRPALKLLPSPGPDILPEEALSHLTLGGLPFEGSMDLLDTSKYVVYDYKFQSTAKKFESPTNQMWGYLEEMRLRFDLKTVPLAFRFISLSKKPRKDGSFPDAIPSDFEYSCQQVADEWGSKESVVRQMQDVATAELASAVECNEKSCFAYGPCPYLTLCNQIKAEKGDSVLMSFFDDVMKAKGGDIPTVEGVLPNEGLGIVNPPDAPAPLTKAALEVQNPEAPDSSPSSAPKATKPPKRVKEVLNTPKAVFRYARKVNLERVLGPSHKYESLDIELSLEGEDTEDLMTKVIEAVDGKVEQVLKAKKETK